MLKQLISTFLISNFLFSSLSFASGSRFTSLVKFNSNLVAKNDKNKETIENLVKNYEKVALCSIDKSDPYALVAGQCDTKLARGKFSSVSQLATFSNFNDESRKFDSNELIKKFYHGDKKACVKCSGVSDAELKDVKAKLLKAVNEERKKYSIRLFRDAVVNNIVTADDSGSNIWRSSASNDLISCKAEFEEIASSSSCGDKFLNSVELEFPVDRSKVENDFEIDSKYFRNSIDEGEFVVVIGANNKQSKMFSKFKGNSGRKQRNKQAKMPEIKTYAEEQSLNIGRVKLQSMDKPFISNKTDIHSVKGYYQDIKKSLQDKFSKIKPKDLLKYCSSIDNSIMPSLMGDIHILNSFASYEGQLSKESICRSAMDDGNSERTSETKPLSEKKISNNLKKILKDLRNKKNKIALKTKIAQNCKKAASEVKEHLCKDQIAIDENSFYNDHSNYGSHPFSDLMEVANSDEKRAYRALACIHHKFANQAVVKEEKTRVANNGGAKKESNNKGKGSSFGSGGFLVDFNGPNESSEPTAVSSSSGEGYIADKVDSEDSIASVQSSSPSDNTNSYYNNSAISNSGSFQAASVASFNAISPAKIQSKAKISNNKANTVSKVATAPNSAASRESARINELSNENAKLKNEIQQINADAAFAADKESKLKELEGLNREIADLKNSKEDLGSKSQNSNAVSSKGTKKAERSIASVAEAPISNHSEQKVAETYKALSNAKTIAQKKQALSTPQARTTLDASYKNNLSAILSKSISGDNLDQEVSRIVKGMISSGAVSQIQIIEREGVRLVVFKDQSKEIELDKFNKETQGLLEEYVSFLQGNKIQEKRKEIIDLDLKEQVAAKYASFIEEFESELEFQENATN